MLSLVAGLFLGTAQAVVLPPVGRQVWVACEQVAMDCIDTASHTVTASVAMDGIHYCVFGKDNQYVYTISDFNPGVLIRLSTADGTKVQNNTDPDSGTYYLVLAPDGTKAYVPDLNNARVSVYNIPALTRASSPIPIATTSNPRGITITPDGSYVYTGNGALTSVSKIRTSDSTYIGSFVFTSGDGNGGYVEAGRDGASIYCDDGASWVAKLRTSDDTFTFYRQLTSAFNTVIRNGPINDTTNAYAMTDGNGSGADLFQIRLSDWTIIKTIHFTYVGNSFTFNPAGNEVWVVDGAADRVKVYNWPTVSTPTPVYDIVVDHPPRWVAFPNATSTPSFKNKFRDRSQKRTTRPVELGETE